MFLYIGKKAVVSLQHYNKNGSEPPSYLFANSGNSLVSLGSLQRIDFRQRLSVVSSQFPLSNNKRVKIIGVDSEMLKEQDIGPSKETKKSRSHLLERQRKQLRKYDVASFLEAGAEDYGGDERSPILRLETEDEGELESFRSYGRMQEEKKRKNLHNQNSSRGFLSSFDDEKELRELEENFGAKKKRRKVVGDDESDV